MKRLTKTIILAVTILMAIAPLQTQASTKPYMEKLNLSWDLEPDKEITFQTKYGIIGYRDQTVEIKNYKIEDAKKENYKKLTFTAVYKIDPKMTNNEFQKYFHKGAEKYNGTNDFATRMKGMRFVAIVDYMTGENLEYEHNDKNVTVKNGEWKWNKLKTYKDSHGCWWETNIDSKIKVSVTYPKDYKNLCIVVGGSSKYDENPTDEQFWNGNIKFGKTTYVSSKNKKISHAMLVK